MFLAAMPVPRSIFIILFIASVISVSAYGHSDVPRVASLDRHGLMTLVFESWQQTKVGRIQGIKLLPQGENPKALEAPVRVSISPIYVVKLDETHAALLTDAVDVDEQGAPVTCHACSNHLGVYGFMLDEKGWRLAQRQDHVADIGVEGTMGKTGVVHLPAHGYVFFAEWGSCWQGFCGSWLELIGVAPGKVTVLSSGIRTAADNSGAYEDCANLSSPEAKESSALNESPHECFAVTGDWKVVGDQIRMSFKGARRDLNSDGKPKPVRSIRGQASYGVQGGKLVLEAGENPVPGF